MLSYLVVFFLLSGDFLRTKHKMQIINNIDLSEYRFVRLISIK